MASPRDKQTFKRSSRFRREEADTTSQNDSDEDHGMRDCQYCNQTSCSHSRSPESVKFYHYTCMLCSDRVREQDRQKHDASECKVIRYRNYEYRKEPVREERKWRKEDRKISHSKMDDKRRSAPSDRRHGRSLFYYQNLYSGNEADSASNNMKSIYAQQRECDADHIVCPLCRTTLLVKDLNTHNCKSSRGKGGENGSEHQGTTSKRKPVPVSKGVDTLTKNLKDLLLTGQDSDVIVKVDNEEFAVHKAILRIRSSVFASMLNHDMIEKNSGVVKIPDCTPDVFREFLHFIYTGKIKEFSTDNVIQLYYVADKYDVEDLKLECIEYMKNNFSVDAFCDAIALAIQHNENELLDLAVEFFTQNLKRIIKTSNWKLFIKENPLEANELFIKAADKFITE